MSVATAGINIGLQFFYANGAEFNNVGGVGGTGMVINNSAGTYFVRVYPGVEGNTDYTLYLSENVPGGILSGGNNVFGGAGNDSLTGISNRSNNLLGGAGNDILIGGSNSDILVGDGGTDSLTGGGGEDYFRFLSSVNQGVDTIADFQSGIDVIQVYSPNFADIGVCNIVTTGAALSDGSPIFIYNGTTGGLSFDRDGNGTAAAVQFATLTGHPTLTAGDIMPFAA